MPDEEEVDFDDPRFLVDLPTPSTSDLPYHERRRKQAGRGRYNAQQLASRFKSRKQTEEDLREQGLNTSLIDGNSDASKEPIALKMMKKMGYSPGQMLGIKRSAGSSAEGHDEAQGVPGAEHYKGRWGSSTSQHEYATPTYPEQSRFGRQVDSTEPIKVEVRDKRTGLGIPQAKKSRYVAPETSEILARKGTLDAEEYRATVRSAAEDSRAWRQLYSLRRTLEELDRRQGIEDSPMWKDPEDWQREQSREPRNPSWTRTIAEGIHLLAESDEIRDEHMQHARGLSRVVIDTDEEVNERAESAVNSKAPTGSSHGLDEATWLSLNLTTRLSRTIQHLRTRYSYCLYCGEQFSSPADLEENCPGEWEHMH